VATPLPLEAAPGALQPPLGTRAALYLVPQAQPDGGRALAKLEAFRQSRGYIPAGTYQERAADLPQRPALRKLLGRAKTGAFEVLCVLTLDVLRRTRLDVVGVVVDLHAVGVEVVSAGGGHLNGDDRALRWLADERHRQRSRIKAGLAAKRSRGERSGEVPLG
jgi:DNA invertase Pin-like site-specific DNA recombinase